MPTFHDLTPFDLVIFFIVLLLLIRGLWIGCIRQVAAFLALVGGYFLAGQYADAILPWTARFVDSPRLTFFVSYGLIFLATVIVCTLIGKLLHRFMRITLLGWLDRLLGLVIGALKATVVASLLYMVLASTLSTTNNLLRNSQTTPFLRQGSEILRSWIDDPRLRQFFLQKEPAILPEMISGKQETVKLEPPTAKQ